MTLERQGDARAGPGGRGSGNRWISAACSSGDDAAEARAAARAQSVQVQTRTVEVGDLFQYEIRNPVSVKRNQSALVPILQETFEGRRVAVYNPEVREKNPMSALQFRNSTGMTLKAGRSRCSRTSITSANRCWRR